MTFWAVVPVSPLRKGNSRLSQVLSVDERTDLNRYLLEHTINILNNISDIEQVLVISRDSTVLSIARELDSRTVQENGSPDLNIALARATIVAKSYSARGVLVLPTDLPLITKEDINTILDKVGEPPVVVIAPDRHGDGTNALLVSPAGLINYKYGPSSFQKHCDLARDVGARLEICELPSLTLDLDDPDDLEELDKTLSLL